VRAYGHFQAATVPTMGVQIIFGDTVFATKATWMKTSRLEGRAPEGFTSLSERPGC
jgi:hypothetical protein